MEVLIPVVALIAAAVFAVTMVRKNLAAVASETAEYHAEATNAFLGPIRTQGPTLGEVHADVFGQLEDLGPKKYRETLIGHVPAAKAFLVNDLLDGLNAIHRRALVTHDGQGGWYVNVSVVTRRRTYQAPEFRSLEWYIDRLRATGLLEYGREAC